MVKFVEFLILIAIMLSSFGSVLSYHPPLGVGKDIVNFILLFISLFLFVNKDYRYNKVSIMFFSFFMLYYFIHIAAFTSLENIVDGLRFHIIYIVTYVIIGLRLNLTYGDSFFRIARAMFYSGTIVALIGLYEFFDPTILKLMYGVAQEDIPNIKLPLGYRLISTMLNPINLGAYLCFVLVFGYLLYRKSLLTGWAFYGIGLISLGVNFLTLSRLAFLAMVLIWGAILYFEFKRSIKFKLFLSPIVFLVIVYFSLVVLPSVDVKIIARMFSAFDSNTLSENSRLDNWALSLSYMDDFLKVLWGLGLGVVRAGGDQDTLLAENTFLGIFIEFGLIGFLIYLIFIMKIYYYNLKLKKVDLVLYQFNLLFFSAFFVLSLGNDMYTNYPFVLFFWVVSSYLISFGCKMNNRGGTH
ncbi:O-antigen ligase family protein [Vibrio vulnificus]|nr:O-antigen ligase family protein [Vibrio vulnificus]